MKIGFVVFISILSMNVFGMNKAELIDAIASDSGLSKADAKRALETFSQTASTLYRRGKAVSIPGVGIVCKVKEKANRTKCSSKLSSSFTLNQTSLESSFRVYFNNFNISLLDELAKDVRKEVTEIKNIIREEEDGFGHDLNNNKIEFNPMATGGVHLVMAHFSNAYGEFLLKEDPSQLVMDERTAGNFIDKWNEEMNIAVEKFNQRQQFGPVASKRAMSFHKEGSSVIYTVARKALAEAQLVEALDNSSILIDKVKKEMRLDEEIDLVFKSLARNINLSLAKGDKVSLIGFGTFSISNRAARTGRNPQTGATIQIKAKKVAKFKAGKALADTVK